MDSPHIDIINELDKIEKHVKKDFEHYFAQAQIKHTTMPDVNGMAGMDAVSLLENLGLNVKINGNGKVVSQSVPKGEKIVKGKIITLELS